jgi:two-component system CheB/CheR fusion protein
MLGLVNAAPSAPKKRKLHVLIADDDADTVLTLSTLLQDEGHTVSAVYSGVQVLHAIKRYKPEVCILDIEMPGQSGYATAREIAEKMPQRERPFLIAISGRWTHPSDQLLAESVGFAKFFLKPADPQLLVSFLAEVCIAVDRS